MAALHREQLRGDFGPGDCEDDDYDDYDDYDSDSDSDYND
jgi:hypothetical protein